MTDATQIAGPARMPSAAKIGALVALALTTLIPGLLMGQLVGDREDRAAGVQAEMVRAWGPAQQVAGPTLVLIGAGKNAAARFLTLAPRSLDVLAVVTPTTRRRGLFATTLYEAALTIAGSFELPAGLRDGGPEGLRSDRMLLAIGLAGTQGVHDGDRADVGGVKQIWQSCADLVAGKACQANVLVADVDLAKAQGTALPFSLTLHLRGTGALRIASAAKHLAARIEGAWPTPSFIGTDLPSASTVVAGGFTAQWARDRVGQPRYSDATAIGGVEGESASVGVDLIEGTPVYRAVTRIGKYGLLLVALAFAAYLLFEVVTGVRVALFQYAMVGASLSLFTLLLLSIGEIAGYGAGYAASALLVIGQASTYTWSVTRGVRPAAAFAAMLASVLGFFYVLLGLETYALVVGAAALFVMLSIVMGVTQAVSGTAGLRTPT